MPKESKFQINCPMCKSFVKEFFTHAISLSVRDLVIAHLLECNTCADDYIMYSVNIGLTGWDVKKEARKLIMSCGEHPEKCKRTKEALERVGQTKVAELKHGYFTRAANNWDVGKLMRLKAFADLLDNNLGDKDYSELDEKLADNRMDFWKHETIKIAKHIDHLEECLAKSKEDNK